MRKEYAPVSDIWAVLILAAWVLILAGIYIAKGQEMTEKYLCVCGEELKPVVTEYKHPETGEMLRRYECPMKGLKEAARQVIKDYRELAGEIPQGHKLYELAECVKE